jgi:hypothetical protein
MKQKKDQIIKSLLNNIEEINNEITGINKIYKSPRRRS